MRIKMIYNDQADIPEGLAALYTEQDGKWVLTNVDGMRTTKEYETLNNSLKAERAAHAETKAALKGYGDLKPEELQAKLDRLDELEAHSGDKVDEEAINRIVEARVKSRLAPVERERDNLKGQIAEKDTAIAAMTQEKKTRTIHDAVRAEAAKLKVADTAMEDVLMLAERVFDVDEDGKVSARDNVGTTPGSNAEMWLTEMQEKRPHWWPASQGTGSKAQGGGGGFSKNPWSGDNWNLTEQGKIVKTKGLQAAEQMAAAVGSRVGATRPPKKN